MRSLIITAAILVKLQNKHGVSEREIEQCFENRCGVYLEDTREAHRTDPPTYWFVAETNKGRCLKVCFMFVDGNIHVKTAYEPNEQEKRIYETHGKE